MLGLLKASLCQPQKITIDSSNRVTSWTECFHIPGKPSDFYLDGRVFALPVQKTCYSQTAVLNSSLQMADADIRLLIASSGDQISDTSLY